MPASPGAATILVADDDEKIREVLRTHLESLGFHVLEARDGEEALEVAHRAHPQLVILDINMPKKNGWEVASLLRQGSETREIKLLVLSGIGESVLQSSMGVFGADMALDKPFELEELEEALTELLKSGTSTP